MCCRSECCFSSFHYLALCILVHTWAFDSHRQTSGSHRLSHPPFLLSHIPPTLRQCELFVVFCPLCVPLNTQSPLLLMSLLSLLAWLTPTCPLGRLSWAFAFRSSPCVFFFFFTSPSHSSTHIVFLICFLLDSYNTWYTFLNPFCTGRSLLTCSPAILPQSHSPFRHPYNKACSKTQHCSLPWDNLTRAGR